MIFHDTTTPNFDSRTSLGLKQAELSLDFVIIGASVAGLACAYNLRQAGHNVHIVEAADSIGIGIGHGIRIPPNMTRLLQQWGLGPELEKRTLGRCPKIVFHSGLTGDLVGELVFHEEVMKELEADVYLIHYGELIEIMYNLIIDVGASFDFGARVVSVDPSVPSVRLSDGREIAGDIIIGADGDRSIIRPMLQTQLEDEEDGDLTCYIYTVPRNLIEDDDELRPLLTDPAWNLWMGNGWSFLVHSMHRGTDLSVILFHEEKETDAEKGWKNSVLMKDLLQEFDMSEFAPRLRRLLSHTNEAVQVRHVIQTPLDSWFDEQGHIVVVGDAAHVFNPGGSHGAALAVEDAAVLGSLFSHLHSRDQITQLLSAYQELRQLRCELVRQSEIEKVKFIQVPTGPAQEGRDVHMRGAMETGRQDWTGNSDNYLREQWEEFKGVFGYNAYDDADTWWIDFGFISDRMKGRPKDDFIFGQVLVEVQAEVQTHETTVNGDKYA